MNPYKFIAIIIYALIETVLMFAVSIIAIMIFGSLFLFDRTIRDGRIKNWLKWD